MINQLKKINKIDASVFLLKTKSDTDINQNKKKNPHLADLAKNTKITETEGKILYFSALATKTGLTAVQNKIPDVNSLVKKTACNPKFSNIEKEISDHNHDKYITTPEFNKLTAEDVPARLKQANLITKTDFHDKLKSLNKKIISNKTKYLLVENELKKLQTFDSINFRGKSHFEEDGT